MPSLQASPQDATFGTQCCPLLPDSILENKVGALIVMRSKTQSCSPSQAMIFSDDTLTKLPFLWVVELLESVYMHWVT